MILYSKDFSQQAAHSPWVLGRHMTPNNNQSNTEKSMTSETAYFNFVSLKF